VQENWHALETIGAPGTADEANEFRHSLSGRQSGLAWRFFCLAPIDFASSLELQCIHSGPPGNRLVLAYLHQ
jgi:hypothetical protein